MAKAPKIKSHSIKLMQRADNAGIDVDMNFIATAEAINSDRHANQKQTIAPPNKADSQNDQGEFGRNISQQIEKAIRDLEVKNKEREAHWKMLRELSKCRVVELINPPPAQSSGSFNSSDILSSKMNDSLVVH